METYRLKSKLVENDREFLIQTLNDTTLGAISSEIYVDGILAETVSLPHPMEIKAEEVLSLLKEAHGEKKKELETLLSAGRKIMASGNPEMMLHLGTALFYKGFFSEARRTLTALLGIDPRNHQAAAYLGMTCMALDEVDEAVAAARSAAEARPGYADYHNNYGEALLAAGQFELAHREFNEAIQINLYYGDAYFNLGLTAIGLASTHELTRRPEELARKAGDCFRRAAMINTGYDAGYYDEGMRAIADLDLSRAWTAMNAVKSAWKDRRRREFAGFHMRFVLHPEWVSERTLEERIRYLENEIRRNPTYVDLYAELARCCLEHSRLWWQKGIAQYRKTTELNPSLQRAAQRLHAAEEVYGTICSTLDEMGPKG